MITRKDLANYSREDIYEALRWLLVLGKSRASDLIASDSKHLPNIDSNLLSMLCEERSARLMLIIRGYAKDGKDKQL